MGKPATRTRPTTDSKEFATATERRNRAVWLQLFVEQHFGFDLANLTDAEVRNLGEKLAEYSSLGVSTEDLSSADEYSSKEMREAGYKNYVPFGG